MIVEKFKHVTLEEARLMLYRNEMTAEEWEEYCHAWQTSAPRFAIRACGCAECRVNYPYPEYRSL